MRHINGDFVAGWGPVDDVTLYPEINGQPLHCLYCDDWQDGRIFKVVSPVGWAGDWRGYESVTFDEKIFIGSALLSPSTMLAVISVHGALFQPITESPALAQWNQPASSTQPNAATKQLPGNPPMPTKTV